MKGLNRRVGKPIQVYVDGALKTDFERLIEQYDPGLSTSKAIRKLMIQAVLDYYLPGYIRKDKTVTNTLGEITPPRNKRLLDSKVDN